MTSTAAPGASIVNQLRGIIIVLHALVLLLLSGRVCRAQGVFQQTNLVSSVSGLASVTDSDLKNPWGMSFTSTSPFWVANNRTGSATLYQVSATDVATKSALKVTIPGDGSVTGVVNNPTSAMGGFNADAFLFVSEDGTVSGWRPALGTNAEVLALASIDNVYKGAAIAVVSTHGYLYASNFHAGTIDVYRGDPGAPSLSGNFTDPVLPSGFAPFGIRTIGSTIYVTYALQDAAGHDDVPGAGNGFVTAFDLNGNFVARIVSRGVLNSPWGLALAPSTFGPFGGALLIGNFGDGVINAFDLTGTLLGTLDDAQGNPIVNQGLWGLTFGNGGNGGDPNALYFTAGIVNEDEGLFGSIRAVAVTDTPTPQPTDTATAASPTETPTNTASPVAPTDTPTVGTTPTPTTTRVHVTETPTRHPTRTPTKTFRHGATRTPTNTFQPVHVPTRTP
jgi:uncharacterized protein (TIGR03118 family)